MNLPVLADRVQPWPYLLAVLAVLALVLALVIRAVRRAAGRTPVAVIVAAVGAILCTAYSADTSWGFARDHLGMTSAGERAAVFGAAEWALFGLALMARQNLRTVGAPGTPGALVWVVTGVQVIPAYSESGVLGGTVRAFVGPVLAAVQWHLAMGIELRHARPGAGSQSLPAIVARELRERLLAWLGLSQRGRDAAQISRDRWTRIATRRAARLADLTASNARAGQLARARRRLAAAVDRTDAGVLDTQRGVLLDRIAAYRGAASLATVALAAPWERPPTPAAVEVELQRVPAAARPVELGVPPVPPPAEDRTPVDEPDDSGPEPEQEPDDDSPPPPAEDLLTAKARGDFLDVLVAGAVPSIRDLKAAYGIGQPRATRIQRELKKGTS